METITSPSGDKLSVGTKVIEIDTQVADVTFEPSEEEKYAIVEALLGEAPPLDEVVDEDFEKKSEQELLFIAKKATAMLKERSAAILRKTREEEAALAKEARKRIRQIQLIEKAYLSTQTGRRAQSTQASQNIAEALYKMGNRMPDPEEGSDQPS